jgi:phage gp36-like protein
MAYASQSDLEQLAGGTDRLVELLDWDNDGALDPGALASILEEVDSWADGFIEFRYNTPLADAPHLKQLAAAECVYRLRQRRGMASEADQAAHMERLRWLEGVRDGRIMPGRNLPTTSENVRSQAVTNNRDVSRDKLKGFI